MFYTAAKFESSYEWKKWPIYNQPFFPSISGLKYTRKMKGIQRGKPFMPKWRHFI